MVAPHIDAARRQGGHPLHQERGLLGVPGVAKGGHLAGPPAPTGVAQDNQAVAGGERREHAVAGDLDPAEHPGGHRRQRRRGEEDANEGDADPTGGSTGRGGREAG
jgi:hypothetical protein